MGSSVWVEPKYVTPIRFIAEYYTFEYLSLEERLDEAGQKLDLKPLGSLGRLFAGPFGSTLPTSVFVDEGIPLLRVQNVGELEILTDNLANIGWDTHQKIIRSKLVSGDLAIAKAGRIGTTAIIPSSIPECNVTQHVVGVQVSKNRVNNYYLAAFLVSKYGQFQFERQGVGTLLKYLGVEDTRQAKVVLPPRPMQEYIGAKVRLAEQCRTRAGELRQEARRCLDAGVGIDIQAATQITEGKRFHALAVQPEIVSVDSMLVSRRLDSAAYSPVRLALLDLLEDARCEFLSIETAADDVTKQRRRHKRDKHAASYFVSILHLNNKGMVDFREAQVHNPASSGIVCQIGDILFSGINPRQNRVAVWTKEGRALCSAEFSIYRPRKDVSPFYLAFVWRSVYCLNQLEALTRGTSSSRRRLKEEDFAELLVPVLTPDDQALIAHNEQRAVELDTRAAELVREAKADVEALIEGRLDVEAIVAGRVQPPTWEDVEV